jgi:hypothetical protein
MPPQPDDIFKEVDSNTTRPSGGKLSNRPAPVAAHSSQPLPQPSILKSRWPWLAVAAVVLLVGIGSAVAMKIRQTKSTANVAVKNSNTATKNGNVNASVSGGPVGKVAEVTNDADHDGLVNEEEKSLGTNPNLTDTDHDGLSDFDEVKVELPEKFIAKIDQTAKEKGLTGTEDFLNQWNWSDEMEREGVVEEVAKVIKDELEKDFNF